MKEGFVVSHAAVSARNGVVKFPDGKAGLEGYRISNCDQTTDKNSFCVNVPMYSLDSYVQKFVKSRGPITFLSIDTEGWDFDVLFGGSSTIDRTFYLEFKYHEVGMFCFMFAICWFSVIPLRMIVVNTVLQCILDTGNWANYKLQNAVRLLDGKGELIVCTRCGQ